MTEFGTTLFSFPDPRAPKWALVILGLALLVAGGLIGLVFAIDPPSNLSDAIGFGAMIALFLVGGASLAAFGVWDLRTAPEWHVTATHAFRARGSRVVRAIALREAPTASMTQNVRYGHVVSVRVDLGRAAVIAPSVDVARAIVGAWQNARRR
jgi:hypothetical protein